MGAEILQTVWPAGCAACDRAIPDEALFCGACNLSINPMVGACPGCALPLAAPGDAPADEGGHDRCATCRRVPFPFGAATSGFEYGEALAEALVRMKHGGRRDLGRRLARLLAQPLAEALARGRFESGDAVVPVPLHPSKLRARGFNQSVELARWAMAGLSAARALSPRPPLPRLEPHLLQRTRPTAELGRAGPAARLAAVAGAFAVAEPARLRGRRVLLVDDVFTTGATFSACADALVSAGARAVHVLSLARAV
ncbi:MAG TPA: ComF family protein [Polyangia bacterium]|nr:ComF family protein [Polyangia bacterium]